MHQDLPVLADLFNGGTASSFTGQLSTIIRHSGQLPVLTTNSFYTNVLFPQLDSNALSPSNTCRTSLVYLLPSSSHDEPSMLFPSFPPSYSVHETRPLSAYTCSNATESGDGILQPVLLVEEHPPPYVSSENVSGFLQHCNNSEIDTDLGAKSSYDDIVILIEPSTSMFSFRSSPAPSSSSSKST